MPTGENIGFIKACAWICNAPLPGLGTRTSNCLLKSSNPMEISVQFHNLQQPDKYQAQSIVHYTMFSLIVYFAEVGINSFK
jgi:hypothetical protein